MNLLEFVKQQRLKHSAIRSGSNALTGEILSQIAQVQALEMEAEIIEKKIQDA